MTDTLTNKKIQPNNRTYVVHICLLLCVLVLFSVIRMWLSLKLFEITPGHRYNGAEQQNLLTNPYIKENWVTFRYGAAESKVRIKGDNIVLTTIKSDAIDWHIQTGVQAPVLKPGIQYIASFRARTDTPRDMMVNTPSSSPIVHFGYTWRDYNFKFHTTNGNNNVIVPQFNPGSREGRIWITDLKVTEAK